MRYVGNGVQSNLWPLPGSARGNKRREAAEIAFLSYAEETPLTNWQTHQWERACRKVPVPVKGKRRLPDRYPFSKLERRKQDAHAKP